MPGGGPRGAFLNCIVATVYRSTCSCISSLSTPFNGLANSLLADFPKFASEPSKWGKAFSATIPAEWLAPRHSMPLKEESRLALERE
jgi:hypothetical protein